MGEKFKLRMSTTKEQLSMYGLPIDPIYEKGVIFKGSENIKEGEINHVKYVFEYFDEQGEKMNSSLEKPIFESFFEKEIFNSIFAVNNKKVISDSFELRYALILEDLEFH